MMIAAKKIKDFLFAVDKSFPTSLSERQDLHELSEKLAEKGTVCYAEENSAICSMALGYTDNVIDNMGYISVVATVESAKGKGYASRLVKEFLDIARRKGLRAVHLYAVRDNIPAMHMYSKLGFVDYILEDEPRPNDAHLVYYFDKEVQE